MKPCALTKLERLPNLELAQQLVINSFSVVLLWKGVKFRLLQLFLFQTYVFYLFIYFLPSADHRGGVCGEENDCGQKIRHSWNMGEPIPILA